MTDLRVLADSIAARVAAVPAVTDLYPAGPAAARLIGARPLARVHAEDGVVRVLVAVGVAEGATAPVVGAEVRAAIEHELDAVGIGARHVTVRIATIG